MSFFRLLRRQGTVTHDRSSQSKTRSRGNTIRGNCNKVSDPKHNKTLPGPGALLHQRSEHKKQSVPGHREEREPTSGLLNALCQRDCSSKRQISESNSHHVPVPVPFSNWRSQRLLVKLEACAQCVPCATQCASSNFARDLLTPNSPVIGPRMLNCAQRR